MEEFTWELVLGKQEGLERKELKTQEGLRVEKSGWTEVQRSRGCGMVPFPFSSVSAAIPDGPQAWRPL